MHTRHLVPLLVVGAIAFACGPRPHAASEPTATAATSPAAAPKPDSSGTPLATSLRVTVEEGVDLAFHITNASDRAVELRFGSGQTHDFVVLDSVGRELWRWSEGRMFTQAFQTRMLGAGETVTFTERWTPPARQGTYTAVATLRSVNHPLESRVEIVLP
jgi:hypothetical protein